MRRVLLALGGTVAGLIMLLSFKTHPVSVGTAAAGSTGAGGAGGSSVGGSSAGGSSAGSVSGTGQVASGRSGSVSSGAAGAGAAGAGAAGSGAAGAGAGGSQGAGSAGSPGGSRSRASAGAAGASRAATTVVTGQAVSTAYGPMQVQATLTGGRLSRVTVLQETNVGIRSQQIDATAVPELTHEALTAQSARIDAVSGASYTSSGYIQSLQSALDKARS
jgi:uncharacterized protein with FMN-binding domain